MHSIPQINHQTVFLFVLFFHILNQEFGADVLGNELECLIDVSEETVDFFRILLDFINGNNSDYQVTCSQIADSKCEKFPFSFHHVIVYQLVLPQSYHGMKV